jgi:RND family efflux transporter MFP subunit
VIDPTRLEVVASVPVQDLARIVVGNVAHIVNPVTGQSDEVKVLTKPAAVDPASATADVRLAFATPTTLSVGTGVSVRILAEERHGVLIVPTAALTHNDDGEKVVMVVGKDNKAHEQPIQAGLATHDFTEITSGLKAGDQVVVRGLQGLPDGALVSIIK